jgi:hypothetical protein
MTMLEKMARAIADASLEDFEDAPEFYLASANAALQSLLQPDEGTVEAMTADDVPLEPRAVFTAAIEHMLKGGELWPTRGSNVSG